jgi:hypothetical protein
MNARFIMLALGSSLLFACSNSSSTSNPEDASTGTDANVGTHDSGSGNTDSGGGSTSDGGGGIACIDPSGCTSAAPVCCGTIPITGGSGNSCTTSAPTTACTTSAACPTMLAGCTPGGAEQVQFCSVDKDCAGATGYTSCCTFAFGGGTSVSFCSSPTIAGLANGTCTGGPGAADGGSDAGASGDSGSTTDAGSGEDAGVVDAGADAG